MRPKLPPSIEQIFPEEVVLLIYSFVPHSKPPKQKQSPSLQKELQRIQTVNLSGKNAMYMKDLTEFCLD